MIGIPTLLSYRSRFAWTRCRAIPAVTAWAVTLALLLQPVALLAQGTQPQTQSPSPQAPAVTPAEPAASSGTPAGSASGPLAEPSAPPMNLQAPPDGGVPASTDSGNQAQPGAVSDPAAATLPADAPPQEAADVGPAPTMGHAALPRDLSPWGMFVAADIVVQSIMVGLALASLVTWTVWLAKTVELAAAKRRVRRGVSSLQQARSLADVDRRFEGSKDVVARLVRTASAEVALSPNSSSDALKERVSWLLHRIEVAAGRRITRGMGMLASIGAIAPFVGLFGTVWGIMNSFIGISNAQTTNLAVVAPGIAEALLATALGLAAAIPAVVIYNMFTRSVGGYRILVADASALVMRLVSRDSEGIATPLARAAE